MSSQVWVWIAFNVFVLMMLAVDLGVLHRRWHEVTLKEALLWSGVWIALALLLNLPSRYQHKVLFSRILGALVMRALFIFAGISLLQQLHSIIYVFGALLIFTGIKMVTEKDKEIHPEKNPVLTLFHSLRPVTEHYQGDR